MNQDDERDDTTKAFHAYRVGDLYSPNRTRWPDAGEYNYRSGAHELRLFFSHLTDADVKAITRGPAEFGLARDGPVLFFLYHFESAVPWSDAPYTLWMVPQEQRVAPRELNGTTEAVMLTVLLVEATNGIIRGIRAVALAPRFSATLHQWIREQLDQPFDQASYDAHLADVYARSSTQALLAKARTGRIARV